jgi:GPH family glycoside/pentoside/hexuronide:cation symporter
MDWYAHREAADEPSRRELVSYSIGGTGVGLGSCTLMLFSTQIWVMNLGLDPRILGIIAAVKMLWDGINDSLFGHVTDNWRGRWGRRRPFIALGGILFGLMMMGYWWFNPAWPMKYLLIWYTASLFLFEGAQTIHSVPYFALGVELSPSYSGRTRVVAYREFMGRIVNILYPWFKPLALLGAFGGILYGARVVCMVVGVFVIVASVYSAATCRERIQLSTHRKKEPFLKAVVATSRNPHFWRLLVINVVIGVMGTLFNQFLGYLSLGYVFGGNQAREATFAASLSILGNVVILAGVPATVWFVRRIGKHRALAWMIVTMIVGSLLKLKCYDPQNPYLMVFLIFFGSFGQKGAVIILSSMQADVVDTDELNSGHRREGLFGGVQSTIGKAIGAITAALSGFVLAFSGYVPALKLNQSLETYHTMLRLGAFGPACCLLLVLCLLWRYPLTETRMKETRDELERRRVGQPAGGEATAG